MVGALQRVSACLSVLIDFRALRLFLHSEVFADEAEFQKKLFHALHIQAGSVMAVIVLYTGNILIAFREELVIVQVTGVAGDAVVVAHVDSLCHLLAGYQCLIQFLAVARADGLHLRLTVFRIILKLLEEKIIMERKQESHYLKRQY